MTTLLTLAAWGIRAVAERRSKGWPSIVTFWRGMTLLDKAVAGFVLIAALSLLWARLKGVAATELRQMVLEPVAMYLVLRTMRFSESERWWIIHLLMLTGVVVAGYGFYQFVTDWVKSPGQFTCLRSTFGTCNNAALYLGRLIPISAAITLVSKEKWRWLYAAAGVAMLAAAVLTVSRGGLLLGIPAALALVIVLWGGRRGVMIVVAGVVLELIVLIPLVMFVPRFRDMLDLTSGSSSSFFRTQVWQSTFRMLQDHPVTGVGLDQFLYEYRGHYIMPDAWQQPDLSQPHNFLLDYWVRLGLVGLGIAVMMHYAFWQLALKVLSHLKDDLASRALVIGLLGGMANMIAHGMVDETHFVIDLAFIFFMSLGLLTQIQPDKVVSPE
jgi:O-antigen ligase